MGHPYDMVMEALSRPAFKVYAAVTLSAIAFLIVLSNTLQRNTSARIDSLFLNINLVALLGAYTALGTKCLSSLISFAFAKALTYALTYVLIALIMATAVLQVIFLNRALQNFEASLVVPLHFVFFTVSVIAGSGIVFRDFQGRDSEHLMIFFIGCVNTFIGVLLIATSNLNGATQSSAEILPSQQLLSAPARPVLNSSTSAGTVTHGSFGDYVHHIEENIESHDELEPLMGRINTRRDSTDSQYSQHKVVSSMPLANSGFFIGSVLETRRSLNALKQRSRSDDSGSSPTTAARPRKP